MSGLVDVGEAFEVTFTAEPGSAVTASWLDPAQNTLVDQEPVPEGPAGRFSRTFVPNGPGVWTAWFYAPAGPERFYIRAQALTGPPPFAAVGDVVAQYGALSEAQQGLVAHLLRAGSALLRHHVPGVDAAVAGGTVGAELVALTVTNMVLRVLRNPEGLRAKTVGPFSRTYDTTAAAGLLVVTDYDRDAVTPAGPPMPDGLGALGIGTIRVQPTMMPPLPPGWVGYGRY